MPIAQAPSVTSPAVTSPAVTSPAAVPARPEKEIPLLGVTVSLLLHAGVAGALVYAALNAAPSTERVIAPIVVELVTLDVTASPAGAGVPEVQVATPPPSAPPPAAPKETEPAIDAMPFEQAREETTADRFAVEGDRHEDDLKELLPAPAQDTAVAFMAPPPRRRPMAASPPHRATTTVSTQAMRQRVADLQSPTASKLNNSVAAVSAKDTERPSGNPAPERPGRGSAERTMANYLTALSAQLAQARRYPRAARRRGLTGTGILRLTLTENGTLESWRLVGSTGHQSLDEEIAALVRRAAPFPAFPEGMARDPITLQVPISFMLR